MKKDGTYQKLYNKWFPSEMVHRQNMITIAVVSLLTIILLVMYGISLLSEEEDKADHSRGQYTEYQIPEIIRSYCGGVWNIMTKMGCLWI
jgi:hypothetical protein